MTPRKIHLVMAARPNIMKVAPLYFALRQTGWAHPLLVHTGQHYDENMSGAFLRDFNLPAPDYQLGIGSGTYAEQTGRTMIAYESLCYHNRPDACVVVGDVNATVACAITAKKMHLPVVHLEAGLRAFDRDMPEEINRIVTDSVCDLFWTPSDDASENLVREGVERKRIAQVGNIMIDAFQMLENPISASTCRHDLGLPDTYALATFHRPANVDDPHTLTRVVDALLSLAQDIHTVFPVHPRTASKLEKSGLMHALKNCARMTLCPPLPYIPFMNLVSGARLVVTDSGGVQEETTYLGIPCITMRPHTERPVTVRLGTNQLAGFDTLLPIARTVLATPRPPRPTIPGWDGHTAQRATESLKNFLTA